MILGDARRRSIRTAGCLRRTLAAVSARFGPAGRPAATRPGLGDAASALAQSAAAEDRSRAGALYLAALAVAPGHAASLFNLAVLREEEGRRDEAA